MLVSRDEDDNERGDNEKVNWTGIKRGRGRKQRYLKAKAQKSRCQS